MDIDVRFWSERRHSFIQLPRRSVSSFRIRELLGQFRDLCLEGGGLGTACGHGISDRFALPWWDWRSGWHYKSRACVDDTNKPVNLLAWAIPEVVKHCHHIAARKLECGWQWLLLRCLGKRWNSEQQRRGENSFTDHSFNSFSASRIATRRTQSDMVRSARSAARRIMAFSASVRRMFSLVDRSMQDNVMTTWAGVK